MADEGAFMELVIASERVGDWLETLACTKYKPLRRRGAANALAKAVAESEPYREEATQVYMQQGRFIYNQRTCLLKNTNVMLANP